MEAVFLKIVNMSITAGWLILAAGLVHHIKKGQYVYYSLNTTVLQDLIGWVYGITQSQKD